MFNNETLLFKYNVDEAGNPVSIKIEKEQKQVSINGTIQMEFIPDEYNSINMLGENNQPMYEVFNRDEISASTYYVDYSSGTIYYDKSQFGKVKVYNYYNKGFQLIGASRIYDENSVSGELIVKTLQDIIDEGRKCLELIKSLGDAVLIINKLNQNIQTGTLLHESLLEDIRVGTLLDSSLKADIEQGNTLLPQLTEINNTATQKKQALDQSVTTANNTNTTLSNTNDSATQTNLTLQQTRTLAQADITKINSSGNKSLIIGKSQFINSEYTWTHNMNSKELTVAMYDSVTDEPLMLNCKIIDMNNILIRNSTEHPNVRVVLQAGYYGGNTGIGTTMEEFAGDSIQTNLKKVRLKDNVTNTYEVPITNSDSVFMSDGTTKLTKKIENVDLEIEKLNRITNNRYYLDNIQDINSIILLMKDGDVLDCTGVHYVDKPIIINKNITIINGTFIYKPNIVLRLFNITSPCTVKNISVDGNIINQNGASHYLYDLIVIEDTNNVIIEGCRIINSYGGGISVYSSSCCIIRNNFIENVYDNGIGIFEVGSNDNIIDGNIIKTTYQQNCIFLTASSNSLPTENYIYNNKVINNTCLDAGDTGIESGINTINTIIEGNNVEVKNHPGILLRDAKLFNIARNAIKILSTVQSDGISVVPHYKGTQFQTFGKIENNMIYGDVNRSAIGIFQNNVEIKDNKVICTKETISSDGSNLKGIGILTDGRNDITIVDNDIQNYSNGIYLNYGDVTPTIVNQIIKGNKISVIKYGINLYNCSLVNGSIVDNTIVNCYDGFIKDGNGTKTTKNNNNSFFADLPVRYVHLEPPNNTFIDRKFVFNGAFPKGLYGTISIMKLISAFSGKCTVYGDQSTDNPYAIFYIKNNTIEIINSHKISLGDNDQWKLIVNGDLVQLQNRIETIKDIKFSFIFEA